MKKINLTGIIIMLLFMSCKPFVKLKYGITEPKVVTAEDLIKYLEKNHQDLSQAYIFKDSSCYLRNLKDSIFHRNLLATLVFNKDGNYIEYRTNGQCQWSGGYFLNHFKKDSVYSLDSSFNVNTMANDLISLTGQKGSLQLSKNNDLIIVIVWARFIGKMNERLFSVNQEAVKRKDLTTQVILLNIDMLNSWNLQKNQMLKVD